MKIIKISKDALDKAILTISNGGVVICPTDTVYGFLADASSKKAVDKIFELKKRLRSKPLPVFVKDIEMAKNIAFIDEKHEKILKKHWPGSYTFIFKRKKMCELGAHKKAHLKLFGIDKNTIALRISKHKFLNDLLKKINKPLVQTSVNISGNPALNNIKEIIEEFGDKVDLIINGGNLPQKKPSKIIDLTTGKGKVLRY